MNGLPGMWRLNMTIAVGFSVHNMNRCCPNAHVRVLFIDKKKVTNSDPPTTCSKHLKILIYLRQQNIWPNGSSKGKTLLVMRRGEVKEGSVSGQ